MNDTTAILLLGHPNVGKSVLFHRLTGAYVNVSNYPGTTVEVARAAARFDSGAHLLDTPGVLALPARSDDERATMRALLREDIRVLVQVGDAKNLRRTLALTALLAELGVPMVLALNMHDEATARGITVDTAALAEAIGVPVSATVATGGEGIAELTRHLGAARAAVPLLRYDAEIEADIAALVAKIDEMAPHPRLASRGLGILFLGGDPEVALWLQAHACECFQELLRLKTAAEARADADDHAAPTREPGRLPSILARERSQAAGLLAGNVMRCTASSSPLLSQRIGRWGGASGLGYPRPAGHALARLPVRRRLWRHHAGGPARRGLVRERPQSRGQGLRGSLRAMAMVRRTASGGLWGSGRWA